MLPSPTGHGRVSEGEDRGVLPGGWLGTPSPGVTNQAFPAFLTSGGLLAVVLLGFLGEDPSPWPWCTELGGTAHSWRSAERGRLFSRRKSQSFIVCKALLPAIGQAFNTYRKLARVSTHTMGKLLDGSVHGLVLRGSPLDPRGLLHSSARGRCSRNHR